MKKIAIVIAVLLIAALLVKRKDMTLKQSILKTLYPVVAIVSKVLSSKGNTISNDKNVKPYSNFYDLKTVTIQGKSFDLNALKGKSILIVNTASDCGYTGQYEELQKLHEQHKDKLVVLGFPANDFKEQEKANDSTIATFCKANFGVTFPLMQKSKVVKGSGQNEVYNWLSNKNKNGWNDKAPEWNFSKYLINKDGVLTHYFGPAVSPLSKEVVSNL